MDVEETSQISNIFPDQNESLLVPASECPAASHGLEEFTEVCRICNKEFSSIHSRMRHEKNVHKLYLYKSTAFALIDQNDSLSDYPSDRSSAGDVKISSTMCRFCNKCFSSNHSRIRHENTKHGENVEKKPTPIQPLEDSKPKSYNLRAQQGDSGFVSSTSLTETKKVKSVSIVCRICGKLCLNSNSRAKHELMAHFRNPVKLMSRHKMRPPKGRSSFKALTKKRKNNLQTYTIQTEKDFVDFYVNVSAMFQDNICLCCDRYIPDRKNMVNHLKKWFGDCMYYNCWKCWISFPNMRQYTFHTVNHVLCDKRSKLLDVGLVNCKPYQNYSCHSCKFIIASEEEFLFHFETKHNINDFPKRCQFCDEVFENSEQLREHFLSPCIKKVYCGICKKSFKTQEEFDEHCDIHNSLNDDNTTFKEKLRSISTQTSLQYHLPYPCQTCEQRFLNHYHLLKHLKLIHDDPSIEICTLCPETIYKRYVPKKEIKEHINKYHQETPEPTEEAEPTNNKTSYICNICNNLFGNINEWKSHQCAFSATFKCDECEKYFRNDQELNEHKSSHSKLKLKLIRCSNSNSYMTSTSRPQRRNSFVNQLMCRTCTKCFSTKEDLEEHIKTHDSSSENGTTFNCTLCDKTYMYKFSLNKHIKNHHPEHFARQVRAKSQPPERQLETEPENDDFKRKCPICNVPCKGSNSLYHHNRRYHSSNDKLNRSMPDLTAAEEPGPSESKDTTCKFCNMVCKSSVGLANHLRIHYSGKKEMPVLKPVHIKESKEKHSCITCHKKFTDENVLQEHILTHFTPETLPKTPKDKVFPCIHCHKLCLTSGALKNHIKIHDILERKKNLKKCHRCGLVLMSSAGLARHLTSDCVNKIRKKAYTCRFCNNQYPSTSALNKHLKRHSLQTVTKNLNGLIVKKKGTMPVVLKKNLSSPNANVKKVTKPPNGLTYSCSKCKIRFLNSDQLKNHVKMHIKEEKHKEALNNIKLALNNDKTTTPSSQPAEIFKCELCPESFDRLYSYVSHKGWHKREAQSLAASTVSQAAQTPQKKPVSAAFQAAQTPQKKPPAASTQTSQKRHICEVCKAAFDTLADYRKHLLKHKNHTCSLCNKKFIFLGRLRRHMTIVHNTELQDSPTNVDNSEKVKEFLMKKSVVVSKNYMCTECNISFPDAKRLRYHVLKHVNNTV